MPHLNINAKGRGNQRPTKRLFVRIGWYNRYPSCGVPRTRLCSRPAMDLILVKIFATALALSEVTTAPQAVKTHFDPAQDRAEVVQILRGGCAHMRQAFHIESLNLDHLIRTALTDPKAGARGISAFPSINFAAPITSYHHLCKKEIRANPEVNAGGRTEVYNRAAPGLPAPRRFKRRKLPPMRGVGEGKGGSSTNVSEPWNRRVWVPLAKIPDLVQK